MDRVSGTPPPPYGACEVCWYKYARAIPRQRTCPICETVHEENKGDEEELPDLPEPETETLPDLPES